MRHLRWPGMIMLLGLTLSGCATMNVSSHVVRGLDFTQYHSWQWAPADAVPSSDARLDNPFFRDYFQGAVERELSKRGLVQTHADGATPDLLVHYHAHVMPTIAASNGDATVGACYDENCNVRVIESETGTMMIDVIDARTNRLVWRGWAQTGVEGVLDRPARLETRIEKAVKGMFARFPL